MTIVKTQRVTACNFAIIFGCVYAKTPYENHYNFLSPELDGQLLLNFSRWSVKQTSNLQKSLIEVVSKIYLL